MSGRRCADAIEDLEGATSEPTRQRRVLAASLGTTGVAVALFLALMLSPLEIDELARAPVPTASPSAAPLVQGPAPNARTVRPPTIAVAIEAGTGRAVPVGDRVGETILWMTVTCATCDVFAPRVDLKTIAR